MEAEPKWNWSNLEEPNVQPAPAPSEPAAAAAADTAEQDSTPKTSNTRRRNKYGPRTCRICLDTVRPVFPSTARTALGISAASSKPVYISEDAELGRLLSPCKCKGTQKYVHEGCLDAWRQTSPAGTGNWWQCPTCLYRYQLARLRWASVLDSRITQAFLTLLIFIISIFLLGFIADPIFNLWLDPVGTIGDTVSGVVGGADSHSDAIFEKTGSWSEHFLKGFFSLGVVGVLKSMLLMSPWHWYYRVGGRRRRGNGRDRVEDISLILVLIGSFAALKAIWKGVRALSIRILQRVRDNVLDVGEDDDDDDEDGDVKDDVGAEKED